MRPRMWNISVSCVVVLLCWRATVRAGAGSAAGPGAVVMNLPRAIRQAETTLRQAQRLSGPARPDTTPALLELADLYEAADRPLQLELVCREVLDARGGPDAPSSTELIVPLIGLGTALRLQARYSEAAPVLERALDVARQTAGDASPQTAAALAAAAELAYETGDYARARELAEHALSVYAATPEDAGAPAWAGARELAARIAAAQGRLDEADAQFTLTPPAQTTSFRSLGSSLRTCLTRARIALEQHRLDDVRRFADAAQALAASAGMTGRLPAETAMLIARQAMAEQRPADAETALTGTVEALVTGQQWAAPERHPVTAAVLSALAEIALQQGRIELAELMMERVRRIRETVLGPEHPAVADSLRQLGDLRVAQGRREEAEALYDAAASRIERALSAEHPELARLLLRLARLQRQHGDAAAAEDSASRALAMLLKVFDPTHPDTTEAVTLLSAASTPSAGAADPQSARFHEMLELAAQSLSREGTRHAMAGQVTAALALYRRAVRIHETFFGPEDPDLSMLLDSYAELLRKAGRVEEADEAATRAARLRRP